jgi:hypothetical protein
MSVKKVMPKGGRKSSPTLWAMVRGLSDEEWRFISAFSTIFGKGSLQLKLLALLRSMEVYDPVAEKAAFEGNDLKSMRKTAKRWLIRTATKLAFYQTEVSEQVMDVETLLRWGIHDDTMEFIAETKQLAREREEFGWLSILYRQEIKAVMIIYQGAERVAKVAKVAEEAMENGKLVALEAEITFQGAKFLEKGRNELLTTGKLDETYTESYFRSKFFRQNIEDWPISFQIQKLRLDEGLHYFLGRTAGAAKAAEKLLDLSDRLDNIRQRQSDDHARCLFRLSAYYSALGNKQKVVAIIDIIKKRALLDSPMRILYLRRVVNSLLHAALEFSISAMVDEGLGSWMENKAILISLPKDLVQFETYLLVSFQYLSNGYVKEAREVFALASQISDSYPYPSHEAVFRILHLMLLLDEDDERGLQSYGKRYKRHLVAYLKAEAYSEIATAALAFVMILAKASNIEGKDKLEKSLRQLLLKLHDYRQSGDASFRPYIHAMIKWVELHLPLES